MPAVVGSLFGDRTELVERYAALLATVGVERGLIGPREVPRIWERHIVNCAVLSELIPVGEGVVDVGSGAGLPGLVLGIARPDLRVTLLEPLLRRTSWLSEVVAELGLENIRVQRGRAEEQPDGGRRVVTARAVAPLGRLWQWCGPLLAPGGRLLAVKGASAAEELAAAGPELVGVESAELRHCGEGLLAVPTAVVVLVRGTESAGRPTAARVVRPAVRRGERPRRTQP
jgi:16S rRNA (guanine527-N7)-methyltransferase